MTPKQTIAHRGLWWPDVGQQNGLAACADAFAEGYSVEIDVRRAQDGSLVLSHDPVLPGNARPLAAFRHLLDLAQRFPASSLFIDIKEPGTESEIVAMLIAHDLLGRSWLFDFELAGINPTEKLCACAEGRSRLLCRVSDRDGCSGTLPLWAGGVWLDQWDSDWVTAEEIAEWETAGVPSFLVSPELHGRAVCLGRFAEWRDAHGICTDMPHLLVALDDPNGPLHPSDPWWTVRPWAVFWRWQSSTSNWCA
jgi:hypothetical protein